MTVPPRRPVRAAATLAVVLSLFALSLPAQATHGPPHTYSVLTSTGTIVPGTSEIGLAGEDDTTVTVALPFDATLYGTVYPAASNLVVSSNGNIQFTGDDDDYTDTGDCLPEDDFGATVFALFSDLNNDEDPAHGVYTGVVGAAPNRQFVIEWRTTDFDSDEFMNFEIILHEGSPVITVIYGDLSNTGDEVIIGVQEAPTGPFTEHLCTDFGGLGGQAVADGTRLDFVPAGVTGTVTINKTGTGGAPLAGAGFTLFASDCTTGVAAAQVTNASGVATFAGADAAASYCLVETTVPPGYQATANVAVTLTLDPSTGLFGATVPITNTALAASPTPSPTPSSLPNTAQTSFGAPMPASAIVALAAALMLVSAALLARRVRSRGLR